MAILRNSAILLLLLLLTGCYSEFDPKIDTAPVLCLNSLVNNGDTIYVGVSHSWVHTDMEAQQHHSVKDATVRLFANDREVDTNYIPKEGDLIRIEAYSAVYGSANGEVTVPYATQIRNLSFDITVRSIYTNYTPGWGVTGRILFDVNATIVVPSSPDKDHFYRLAYRDFSKVASSPSPTKPDALAAPTYSDTDYPSQSFSKGYFNSSDPIFSEYVSDFEDMMDYGDYYDTAFFADRNFEGASRKIRFGFDGCGFSLTGWNPDSGIMECGYTVTLHTISKSYFDWAMYFWNSERGLLGEFSDMGLAEPIWGYSNVSTGAGVVAAQSSTTVTIDLRPLLEKIMESGHSDR